MSKRGHLSKTMRIDLQPDAEHPGVDKPRALTPTRRYARVRTRKTGEAIPVPHFGDSNFRELFQSVYDAALITDMNGRIQDANVRAIQFLEYGHKELCSMNVLSVLSGADESLLATIGETLQKDRFVLIQAYCVRKDRSTFPVEISTNLLHLSAHDYLCLFIRDITQRVNADQERIRIMEDLKCSNDDLQEFAYIVSHDLQEPLRKITTFGGLLGARCSAHLPDNGRDYLERMLNATSRMQGLIMDLLSLSRISTRAQPYVDVDLNQTVADVLSDLELVVKESHATLEIGNLPTLEAEPVQMRQVFQNLIGNALKFRKPDVAPVVRIRTVEIEDENGDDPGWCAILIEDNGIGFDAKHKERIFGIFQRLHSRSEYEGTGIGLAVCRKIIERHGGTIEAHGQPGEGAKFLVTFPLHQQSRD